ncbi:MAG TPA: ATP-binding protein, partial [Leptospiraceae bacterium]|nr:ATP-binding protein [Leptospiraceae bacterium]
MVYFKRLLETKLKTLFSLFPVVCIQGARQVGKSTLVEKTFGGKIPTVTFDPVTDIDDARKDPDFFLQTHPSPVFLDEIQYAPELLSSLKRKVDREKKAGMYIISGSQNLGILKNISESLAGRVIILDLHTMSQRELNENTENKSVIYHYLFEENINLQNIMKINFPDLKRNLWRGFFPGLIDKPDDAVPYFYDSYLRTYIERDIRVLANLDSMQDFGNFFGILAGLSSTEINPSEIGRELGIDRKTAKRWMMLAEQSFQWITVPSFSRNPVKKVSQKSKGYFTDTGMICSLQKISSPESVLSHPMKGRLFETYIVMEILKTVQEFPVRPNL